MKDRFRHLRIRPDFCVLRIQKPRCLFNGTAFIPSLVVISNAADHVSSNLFLLGRAIGKTTATLRLLSRAGDPFAMPSDEQFRQEYLCKFEERKPEPDCPKCANGELTMDRHGRGWSCRSCGYRSWERGRCFVGVDTSKGRDYTTAVFSHMDGPVMVVDKIVTSKPAPEATP